MDGRTGYRLRGQRQPQRCEGMFVGLQSAALNLHVVTLVKGELRLDTLVKTVRVHVPARAPSGAEDAIFLVGRGAQPNINWALDARLGLGETLEWDLQEVVHREGIGHRIGIHGLAMPAGGLGEPKYVPVFVTATGEPPPESAPLQLIVHIGDAAGARLRLVDGGVEGEYMEGEYMEGFFRFELPPDFPKGTTTLQIEWRPHGALSYPPSGSVPPETITIYSW